MYVCFCLFDSLAQYLDTCAQYLSLLNNYTVSDLPARISFKYASSRAVTGTPTFWVNGVPVAGDPTWGVNEWRQV